MGMTYNIMKFNVTINLERWKAQWNKMVMI